MKASASIALFLSRLVMFKDQLFGQLSINLVIVFGGAEGSIHPAQPWWDTFPHLCNMMKSRPSQHICAFVMTVSTAETFILQGYGSPGYTLLQHMHSHLEAYSLSFNDTEIWAKMFKIFAADCGGIWTKEVKKAYCNCYDDNLVKLGCMCIRSQMDAYTKINCVEFNTSIIHQNFNLLPFSCNLGGGGDHLP
jgi:hypothetical protein